MTRYCPSSANKPLTLCHGQDKTVSYMTKMSDRWSTIGYHRLTFYGGSKKFRVKGKCLLPSYFDVYITILTWLKEALNTVIVC